MDEKSTTRLEQAKRWVAVGCQYIAYSVDYGIFLDACKGLRGQLHALTGDEA